LSLKLMMSNQSLELIENSRENQTHFERLFYHTLPVRRKGDTPYLAIDGEWVVYIVEHEFLKAYLVYKKRMTQDQIGVIRTKLSTSKLSRYFIIRDCFNNPDYDYNDFKFKNYVGYYYYTRDVKYCLKGFGNFFNLCSSVNYLEPLGFPHRTYYTASMFGYQLRNLCNIIMERSSITSQKSASWKEFSSCVKKSKLEMGGVELYVTDSYNHLQDVPSLQALVMSNSFIRLFVRKYNAIMYTVSGCFYFDDLFQHYLKSDEDDKEWLRTVYARYTPYFLISSIRNGGVLMISRVMMFIVECIKKDKGTYVDYANEYLIGFALIEIGDIIMPGYSHRLGITYYHEENMYIKFRNFSIDLAYALISTGHKEELKSLLKEMIPGVVYEVDVKISSDEYLHNFFFYIPNGFHMKKNSFYIMDGSIDLMGGTVNMAFYNMGLEEFSFGQFSDEIDYNYKSIDNLCSIQIFVSPRVANTFIKSKCPVIHRITMSEVVCDVKDCDLHRRLNRLSDE